MLKKLIIGWFIVNVILVFYWLELNARVDRFETNLDGAIKSFAREFCNETLVERGEINFSWALLSQFYTWKATYSNMSFEGDLLRDGRINMNSHCLERDEHIVLTKNNTFVIADLTPDDPSLQKFEMPPLVSTGIYLMGALVILFVLIGLQIIIGLFRKVRGHDTKKGDGG
ncbi:MAG: hypothetical protein H0Z33_03250 [Bacillaceae bacterium]|nr:hypothetical protein [Bacillaceae bacterium]